MPVHLPRCDQEIRMLVPPSPSRRTSSRWKKLCIVAVALCAATPALAQQRAARSQRTDPMALPAPSSLRGGAGDQESNARIADSSVGRAGQREGYPSISRTDTRIGNRVQSRLRNRVDRFYDPQANATSPFQVASDQVRNAGRRP
jgi:hypothetical protein